MAGQYQLDPPADLGLTEVWQTPASEAGKEAPMAGPTPEHPHLRVLKGNPGKRPVRRRRSLRAMTRMST
jgi:hypothetical protein